MRSSPESLIPLSAEGAGQLLHISRQAVDKRRRSGALLAIRQGGDWLYPRTQFHEHEALPRLADVIKGLALLEFLVTEDTVLNGLAPVDALLRGGEMCDRVLTLVRGLDGGEGFA